MISNLGGIEPGRLVEDHVRDAELAEIVEEAGPPDVDDVLGRQAHLGRDRFRQIGDALASASR